MDIKKITLLEDINLNEVKYKVKSYSKNETVYSQGANCNSMDIVISGSLVAYSLSQNGRENIVFKFQKDSVIGANLLFGTSNRYPMNIYCTEDCELLHIERSEVEKLLHNYNFTVNFVKIISKNSQGMNQKIAMYTQKSLRENILNYFEALSVQQKSKIITLDISKKQLADYFGVQRPSLFRELKKLKEEGIIKINNRNIEILY